MTETSPKSIFTTPEDHPFWRRTHEDTWRLAEQLQQPPEYPLSDEEKYSVLDFENRFFEGRVEGLENGRSLEEYVSLVDASFSVAEEYLQTQEGSNKAIEAFPELANIEEEDFIDALRRMPFERTKEQKSIIKTMQGGSLKYTEGLYVQMAKGEIEEREFEKVSFYLKPQELIDNFELLKEYKSYLLEVRRSVAAQMQEHGESNELRAMYEITDIYRDKINAKLASEYPSMLSVYAQAQDKEDSETLERMHGIAGFERLTAASQPAARESQFIRLLDYVRNGATYDTEGKLTPLDENLFTLVHEANEQREQTDPILSPDEIEILRSMKMDAEQMKDFLERYLQAVGLQVYGWSVEIREDKASFAVDGINKKIKVPSTFNRGIIKGGGGSGVVALTKHEVGGNMPGHVMQSVNAERNTEGLRLGREPKFRGKKYVANREAGGVLAEKDILSTLFDEDRALKGSYAAGLGALIETGNRIEAIRAFAKAVATDPENVTDANYKLAANRVSRLLRHGGRDSQALDYVEAAGLISAANNLDKQVVDTLLAEAVFAPRDMMRLHKFGLLPTDSDHLFQPERDPTEIIVEMLRGIVADQRV